MLLFLFGHISCGDDPGLAIMNGQDDQEKTAATRLAVREVTHPLVKMYYISTAPGIQCQGALEFLCRYYLSHRTGWVHSCTVGKLLDTPYCLYYYASNNDAKGYRDGSGEGKFDA